MTGGDAIGKFAVDIPHRGPDDVPCEIRSCVRPAEEVLVLRGQYRVRCVKHANELRLQGAQQTDLPPDFDQPRRAATTNESRAVESAMPIASPSSGDSGGALSVAVELPAGPAAMVEEEAAAGLDAAAPSGGSEPDLSLSEQASRDEPDAPHDDVITTGDLAPSAAVIVRVECDDAAAPSLPPQPLEVPMVASPLPSKKCMIPDCAREKQSRGYCNMHYGRGLRMLGSNECTPAELADALARWQPSGVGRPPTTATPTPTPRTPKPPANLPAQPFIAQIAAALHCQPGTAAEDLVHIARTLNQDAAAFGEELRAIQKLLDMDKADARGSDTVGRLTAHLCWLRGRTETLAEQEREQRNRRDEAETRLSDLAEAARQSEIWHRKYEATVDELAEAHREMARAHGEIQVLKDAAPVSDGPFRPRRDKALPALLSAARRLAEECDDLALVDVLTGITALLGIE